MEEVISRAKACGEGEDGERCEKVRGALPPDEVLYDLAELYKIFGDTTRVKILYALFESELCRDVFYSISCHIFAFYFLCSWNFPPISP